MRTLTTQQQNVLGLTRRASFFKFEVQDPAVLSNFNDLTHYVVNGRTFNFAQKLKVADDIDNPGATATVTLLRNFLNYNLSPLMTGSVLNANGALINVNRQVKISIAVMPYGTLPTANDWVLFFFGRIYQIDFGDDTTFTVQCQDMTGELLSWWVETNFQVGTTAGRAAESVMGDILTTTISTTSYTPYLNGVWSINGTTGTHFNPADSPGWNLLVGTQTQMAVYTALNNINQQIGWLLRQKWNTSAGKYVLTWYDPLRSNTTPAWTFTTPFVLKPATMELHLGDIRNVVHVTFLNALNNSAPMRWVELDSTSISQYGRQFMQMAEESCKQINTPTIAQTMAVNALSDLSQPKLNFTVDMPVFWPVELADVYKFKADGTHYDTDQTLAVVNYEHNIEAGVGSTTLGLRGKPSGGVAVWYDRVYKSVRKQYGVYNASSNYQGALYPNSTAGQYTLA